MIREGRPTDLPALRRIESEALDETWPDLLELAADGPPWLLVAVDDEGDDEGGDEGDDVGNDEGKNERQGTTVDGPIVGYALAIVADGVCYLAELAVAPDRQGKGWGSRLLDALVDRLEDEGARAVCLTARADDERVRSFYRNRGFDVDDVVADHYADGDAVVLVRSLAD